MKKSNKMFKMILIAASMVIAILVSALSALPVWLVWTVLGVGDHFIPGHEHLGSPGFLPLWGLMFCLHAVGQVMRGWDVGGDDD